MNRRSGGIFPRGVVAPSIVAIISVFPGNTDEKHNDVAAGKNDLLLGEGVGSGSGGAGVDAYCRLEKKREEDWRGLRAFMLQVIKAGPKSQ